MTKLRDRLDDRSWQGSDNEPLLDGRWVLEQPTQQNGHTRLEAGELLLDDGATRLRLDSAESRFRRAQLSADELADYTIALDAIAAIDSRTDLVARKWPSPLLPKELGRQSEPTGLDGLLGEALERGHLDAIATRPRLSMRYDSELLPVDRARRLSSGFQRHLAAHSECWAGRTLSGVMPKAVIARVSDDDPDMYEHRVYARLLDYLERYLRKRIRKLKNISNRYEEGLEFSYSEGVNYRLRNDICAAWGEAVSTDDADQLLRRNRDRLNRLARWLTRIRSLKDRRIRGFDRRSLYAAIPQNAQVGLSLVPTNLLQHDPHYRQLRLLWEAWKDTTAAERERPAQVLERRRDDQDRYERYVGLLLIRSLHALGFSVNFSNNESVIADDLRWGDQVSIEFRGHCWVVSRDGHRLTLVPTVAPLDADTVAQWRTRAMQQGRELRVPCALHAPDSAASLSPADHLSPDSLPLRLSPLDLYAQERAHALVSAWLWIRRLAGYGEVFPHLPAAIVAVWPEGGGGQGKQLSLRRPVNDLQWKQLREALDKHANPKVRDRIESRKAQLDRLESCPECTKKAETFSPAEKSDFFARCDCGCQWELRRERFQLTRADRQQPDFANLGHRWLSVETQQA